METTNNQKVKTYFEQAYGRELADEEVVEYKNRLVQFFSLLIEIDQKQKKEGGKNEQIV